MTLPIYRGDTTQVATTGVGSGTERAWIAGHLAGWMAVAVGITSNETIPTPSGFTACPNSPIGLGPIGGPSAVKLHAFYRIATQVTMDANGGAMPSIILTQPDTTAGSFISWFAFFLSDVDTVAPFLALTGAAADTLATAGTAVTIPGGTTGATADCMVVNLVAHAKDTSNPLFDPAAWTNASLANLTERTPAGGFGTGAGSGGGWSVVTGEKAVGGVFSATTGLMTTASVQARLTLAVKGAGAAAAVADSDFNCSAACGAGRPGPLIAPDRRHWHEEIGTPSESQTNLAINGPRAWRFAPTQDVSARVRYTADTVRVLRGYLYFESLPTTDCELIRFLCANGASPELRYRAATQDIVAGTGTGVTTAKPVVVGRAYQIDIAAETGASLRKVSLQVDGADFGFATRSGTTPTPISEVQIGASCGTPTTARVVWGAIRMGAKLAAFPFGQGQGVGLQLVSDGTHSYNGADDFQTNDGITTQNLGLAATTAWQWLVGLLDVITSWLSILSAAAAEYLEVSLGGMPAAASVNCMEVVTAHRGQSSAAHSQTLRFVSGANVEDIFTGANFAGTAIVRPSKHYAVMPGGAAITQALLNALKFRWLGTAGAGWGGIIVEVDYVPSGGVPTTPLRNQKDPVFTYPGPGTYNPTLKVRDDQGLESIRTHTVVIS